MPDNITKILNSVRQDCWAKKLKDIKKNIERYDELKTEQSSSTNKDIEAYLNKILPTYWNVFHTHNTARRKHVELLKRDGSDETCLPIYHIGIFLVGYSSLPIALSLAEIQPTEKIYFLYSEDTREYLSDIFDRLNAMFNGSNNDKLLKLVEDTVLNNLNQSALEINNPSDPVSTFKRIKEIIDNIVDADNKRIALDLTGGKKTMLGGGYTAGAIWASRWLAASEELVPFCDMYYIDSLKYDPDRGSPVPGTEFLSQLKNPYDVYNVQSVQQAEKLFEQRNYEAAAFLWKQVRDNLKNYANKYDLENERDEVQKNYDMANCYGFWDAFDYKKAKEAKNQFTDKYNEKHVCNSIDVLGILSRVTNRNTLFDNEAHIIHYAVDRYQNAIRRKESGRLDDAIIRFTQVVEILCLYHIYKIVKNKCLIDEDNNKVANPPYKWRITPLIRFLFQKDEKYYKDRNGYYQISCSSELLKINDYGYNQPRDITDLIEVRNEFVHVESNPGWKEMQENTEKLQELAKKFLKNFYDKYYPENGLTFDNLLELHRFHRLTK